MTDTTINYEAEVKKVYPNAWCEETDVYSIKSNSSALSDIISTTWIDEQIAWQLAYENLVQKGKIK